MAVLQFKKKRYSQPKSSVTVDWGNSILGRLLSVNKLTPIIWSSSGNNYSPYQNGPVITSTSMIADCLVCTISQTSNLGAGQSMFGGLFGGVPWSLASFLVAKSNVNLIDSFNGNSGNTPFKISTDSNCLASIYFESALKGTYQLIPNQKYTVIVTVTSAGYVEVYFNNILVLSGNHSGGNAAGVVSINNVVYLLIGNNHVFTKNEVYSLIDDPFQIFTKSKALFIKDEILIYRPSSDDVVTGWSGVPGSPLYDNINELAYDDVDYIQSPDLSTPATFGLSSALPVGSYDVKIRANTNTFGQVRIKLLDSGNSVVGTSTWQLTTGSFTTYTLSVTTTGIATKVKIEVQ